MTVASRIFRSWFHYGPSDQLKVTISPVTPVFASTATSSDQINNMRQSSQLCHSHGEGFMILVCEVGYHVKVTLTDVIRTAGLLDVDLNNEKNRNQRFLLVLCQL